MGLSSSWATLEAPTPAGRMEGTERDKGTTCRSVKSIRRAHKDLNAYQGNKIIVIIISNTMLNNSKPCDHKKGTNSYILLK